MSIKTGEWNSDLMVDSSLTASPELRNIQQHFRDPTLGFFGKGKMQSPP